MAEQNTGRGVGKVIDELSPIDFSGIPKSKTIQDDPVLKRYTNRKLIEHAGKNLIGWLGVGFAVRMLLQAPKAGANKKLQKRLNRYINARNPIISVDPSLKDTEEEKEEREIGLNKESSTSESIKKSGAELMRLFKALGREDRSNLHLAATIAASTGGAIAGYKLADKLFSRKHSTDLEKDIQNDRNLMDKLVYDEYIRTRGLNKGLNKESAEEDLNADKGPSANPLKAVTGLWWVYAAAAMALSYKAAKAWGDKNIPSRVRAESLIDLAKDQARIKDAPVLLNSSRFNPEETPGALKPGKSKMRVNVALPKEQLNPVEEKEVDERDPYADIL